MPRWLFLIFSAALALAVLGSALVFLRGSPAREATGIARDAS
jgi:hypothetical protein